MLFVLIVEDESTPRGECYFVAKLLVNSVTEINEEIERMIEELGDEYYMMDCFEIVEELERRGVIEILSDGYWKI